MKLKQLTKEECDAFLATFQNYTQLVRHVYSAATLAERNRCCAIIHGMCGSDNVAQRTVDKILSDE